MRKILTVLSCLFILWGYSSCDSELDQKIGNGKIYGYVTDYINGEPLRNVMITMFPGGNSIITGNDGAFEFQNLPSGYYIIQGKKNGYLTNVGTANVASDGRVSADFSLQQGSSSLEVLINELNYGDTQTSKVFIISNIGEQPIEWSLFYDQADWVTIDKRKGVLEAGQNTMVNISINRTILHSQAYSFPLYVKAGNETAGLVISISRESVGINKTDLVGIWEVNRTEFYDEKGVLLFNTFSSGEYSFIFNSNYTLEVWSDGFWFVENGLDLAYIGYYGQSAYSYNPHTATFITDPEDDGISMCYRIEKLTDKILIFETLQSEGNGYEYSKYTCSRK